MLKTLVLATVLITLLSIACIDGTKKMEEEPLKMTPERLKVAERICDNIVELEYISDGWYAYKYIYQPTEDEFELCMSYEYYLWTHNLEKP